MIPNNTDALVLSYAKFQNQAATKYTLNIRMVGVRHANHLLVLASSKWGEY
jgi:hypothetical protein